MTKKIKIELAQYAYNCGDGCCYNYGTITTVNGVQLESHNEDAANIVEKVLRHLGYEVELIETYNGEEL